MIWGRWAGLGSQGSEKRLKENPLLMLRSETADGGVRLQTWKERKAFLLASLIE
jgi:hypothetical protein